MAALDMPRRGKVKLGECRLRAVHVGWGEIVWQDRCDAVNGSKEPILLKNSNFCRNLKIIIQTAQMKNFGEGFG